ncbi:MAG: response regulator, partial [Anaerolineae bacterium]|nr:response regulator [Anaerolineae bacterium]
LLHQFRDFAREVPGRRVPMDLNALLQDALALRGSSLRSENIAVHLELAPDLPPVSGSRRALGLAFMSLILNAEEAMYHTFGEGTLQVRTSLAREGVVRVEISDDGPGIPPEVQERAFQPFVSTKGERGTGLGLTLARHVVEEHGGSLRFTTVRGEEGPSGTTFVVELPAATPEERSVAGEAVPARAAAPRGRILVVDDEPGVCELIRRALAARGHTVDIAETVDQALAQLEPGKYQAIVCDIRMPGQGGIVLHTHLAEVAPDLARRVLFMTGSLLDAEIGAFLARSGCPQLRKPFELPDLVRLVEGLLAQGTKDA